MKIKICILLLFMIALCGCKSTREIDEQSIVSSMAFSFRHEYSVTVEVLSVTIDEQNIGTRIFKASGETLQKAFAALDNKLPKRLLFDHCAAIILSPDMNDRKIDEILYFCINEPTINLGTPVVFTNDIDALLCCDHESAAVGYDIMQILRHTNCESKSRLYKTVRNHSNIYIFNNDDGKVVKK